MCGRVRRRQELLIYALGFGKGVGGIGSWGLGFGVEGLGSRVSGPGLKVRSGVSVLGFRVQGLGVRG